MRFLEILQQNKSIFGSDTTVVVTTLAYNFIIKLCIRVHALKIFACTPFKKGVVILQSRLKIKFTQPLNHNIRNLLF